MRDVYIVAAQRSAIGSFGGSLKDVPATEIGAQVLKQTMEKVGVKPETVNEVVIGNVIGGNLGMGPGRQVSMYSGIPDTVPAYAVNMLCSSGMKSLSIGAQNIAAGVTEIHVTGGIENMSQAPFYASASMRFGHKMGSFELKDALLRDGLTDVFNNYHMGVTAENIVKKHKLTRQEQDEFALASQEKAVAAVKKGAFKEEIVPITIKTRKGDIVFDTDEYPREGATLEGLGKLRAVFEKDGTVTAGNASGINDGASIIILASEEAVKKYNLKPLAKVSGTSQFGLDPAYMGLGPVGATRLVLEQTGLTLKDMDRIELNEAFAAQSIGVVNELAEEHNLSKEEILERTNVNGGAIALGHPLGASGSRIVVTLLHDLIRNNLKYGLASLCAGGGMGTAVIIEKL